MYYTLHHISYMWQRIDPFIRNAWEVQSRKTNNKAYSMKKVSFEENKTFNKTKVEKFIKFHSKQLNKS